MMPFVVRTEGDVAIIDTSVTELDSDSSVQAIQEVVRTCLDDGYRKFVMDWSHVDYVCLLYTSRCV